MAIKMEDAGSVKVENLKYKDTFFYQGNLYMRVGSHDLRRCIEMAGCQFQHSIFMKSLNTVEKVVVIRLSTGKLSYFKRTTCVTPVDLICKVKEIPDDEC